MPATDLELSPVAVWTGRFQPPHVGHLLVLRSSVESLRLPHLVVMVAYFGGDSDGRYGELAMSAYLDRRNPFTAWERFMLMRLALDEYGLAGHVSIIFAPRHDLDWTVAQNFYPPNRLICLTAKDEFDLAKAALWRSRGEQVNVFNHLGPTDILTTTEIRRCVAAGEPWQKFIVPTCHEFFAEIDGPRRLAGNDQ